MAAWVPDIFSNFYLVKNYKIVVNTSAAKEKKTSKFEIRSKFDLIKNKNKFSIIKVATNF